MSVPVSIRAKPLLALLAAGTAGFALGIITVINLVFPIDPILGEVPAWVPRAEYLGWLGLIGAGLCAGAWMYLDYRHEVDA